VCGQLGLGGRRRIARRRRRGPRGGAHGEGVHEEQEGHVCFYFRFYFMSRPVFGHVGFDPDIVQSEANVVKALRQHADILCSIVLEPRRLTPNTRRQFTSEPPKAHPTTHPYCDGPRRLKVLHRLSLTVTIRTPNKNGDTKFDFRPSTAPANARPSCI
jgi:hypothetical protein